VSRSVCGGQARCRDRAQAGIAGTDASDPGREAGRKARRGQMMQVRVSATVTRDGANRIDAI
jgi:hypothetical protein